MHKHSSRAPADGGQESDSSPCWEHTSDPGLDAIGDSSQEQRAQGSKSRAAHKLKTTRVEDRDRVISRHAMCSLATERILDLKTDSQREDWRPKENEDPERAPEE